MSDRFGEQDVAVATLHEDGTWEVHGVRLRTPVRIRSARAAAATYLVRADRARALVAGTGLDLVVAAGRTPVVLALVEYRDTDLGAYAEVGVALLARHRGRTGPYVHQLPVTQAFTMEAGRALWGLPKWPARAELAIGGRHARVHLADDAGRRRFSGARPASRAHRAAGPRAPARCRSRATGPGSTGPSGRWSRWCAPADASRPGR